MFGKRSLEFKRMKRMLAELQLEEKELPGTIEGKKKALCERNRENLRKEELVRKLKGKLARRQENRVATPVGEKGSAIKLVERRDAVEIFPEEIWELILEKVTDPQDLWNCYNTCALFRRLLHQWKTTWAFEQALPYLFPHLPREKLLECRLISKGWKERVDQFLQNHPSLHPHDEESCNPRTLPFVSPQVEKALCSNFDLVFCDVGGMPTVLEDQNLLNEVRANLTVGREVSVSVISIEEVDEDEEGEDLDLGNDEANEQVWANVYTFFRTFGELISSLNFEVNSSWTGSDWVKQKINQFLKEDLIGLAPNLRRLRLGKGPFFSLASENVNVDWTLSYPHLETLEVDPVCSGRYHPLVWRCIRRHHAQLKKVSLEVGLWTHLPNRVKPTDPPLDWPNLTELYLSRARDFEGIAALMMWMTLPDVVVAMPRLSKLGLESFGLYFYKSNFSWFLKALERLTRTTPLRTLRLVWLGGFHHNVLREPRPTLSKNKLPRLTTLEVEFRSGRAVPHPNFEFLLYFPHLENLHVFWSQLPAAAKGRTALLSKDELDMHGDVPGPAEMEVVEVNKFMYSGEMYRSNIWELLPRLKVFSFQWDIYTRGEYEEHRRKRGERNREINEIYFRKGMGWHWDFRPGTRAGK